MKRLLWITDAHLDHLPNSAEEAWFSKIAETQADMLLLGGDTANSRVFERALGRIQSEFPGKIALVAGNHDYYFTSIAQFRATLGYFHRDDLIVFEPGCQLQPVELSDGVYLCGSGGWGDACAGYADASTMSLNDEVFIDELRTPNLTRRLRDLGKESATHLQAQLDAIPADASYVIVLTHVPPWPDACWHEGRRSDAYALSRFCWQAGGVVISQAAERLPHTSFIVLCGHTHSDGVWTQGNITCYTAGSAYGRIDHSAMVTLGDVVAVTELDRRFGG